MESYRSIWERLMAPDAQRCESAVVFGSPATEADIAALELHFGGQLPADFCGLYQECNGVGQQAEGEDVSWVVVPIDEVLGLSRYIEETLDLHGRVCFFGDYGNGDSWGYVRPAGGTFLEATVNIWDHEKGELCDIEMSLDEFLDVMASDLEEDTD